MEKGGHWEIWSQVLSQAIEVAHRAGDETGAVALSVLLARLLQWQGRVDQAIARYRRVIRMARGPL